MPARIQYVQGDKMSDTRLTFIKDLPSEKKRRRAEFQCDCGNIIQTDLNWVRFGNVSSCGCLKSEKMIEKNTKHSQSSRTHITGAYRSFQAMHQRIRHRDDYKHRDVCDRWSGIDGFKNFYEDMGDRPEGLTIERVDNHKGYSKANCVWADMTTQNNNKG